MRKNIALLSLLLITVPAFAMDKKEDNNDCGILHVQIGNITPTACQLTTSKVVHGNLMTSPPATLPAGFSGSFEVKQTFYGPNVVLDYNCNGQHIVFASQQNLCFMSAGKITGTVVSATGNLRATHTSEEGSYFWSKPGLINWVLS